MKYSNLGTSPEPEIERHVKMLFLGIGYHANHLYETNHSAENDAAQKEPMGVQPVVEQLAKQQSNNNRGGDDECDL